MNHLTDHKAHVIISTKVSCIAENVCFEAPLFVVRVILNKTVTVLFKFSQTFEMSHSNGV